jgi:hypothetical protein
VAARIERELYVDVEKIKGCYGEYKILVAGEIILDGGKKALLGILPSGKNVVNAIKTLLDNRDAPPPNIRRNKLRGR